MDNLGNIFFVCGKSYQLCKWKGFLFNKPYSLCLCQCQYSSNSLNHLWFARNFNMAFKKCWIFSNSNRLIVRHKHFVNILVYFCLGKLNFHYLMHNIWYMQKDTWKMTHDRWYIYFFFLNFTTLITGVVGLFETVFYCFLMHGVTMLKTKLH